MAVTPRQIKNKRNTEGMLTGLPGFVYDVNVKYKVGKDLKQYKKTFASKEEACLHEAEMKAKLAFPAYAAVVAHRGKETVQEYLENWIEQYGETNLRPITVSSYTTHIRNHIVPVIGHVLLCKLTPEMLNFLVQEMLDKGLANSSIRNVLRVLNVALESARRQYYIDSNPARDVLFELNRVGETIAAPVQQSLGKEME